MRSVYQLGLMTVILAGMAGSQSATAQYYDDGYGRPPPRRYYDDREGPPPRGAYGYERGAPPRAVGLNCDAIQYGITGAQPYSCPLPGARPLGARCFCNLPLAPLSSPQTAAGRVVP